MSTNSGFDQTSVEGMSIALALSGIKKICAAMVANQVVAALGTLKVSDLSVSVPNFGWSTVFADFSVQQMIVSLKQGQLTGFNPTYQQVSQDSSGQGLFTISASAKLFTVAFGDWYETYQEASNSGGPWPPYQPKNTDCGAYSFMMGLAMTVVTQIGFATENNYWTINVTSTNATPINPAAGLPGNSVLQNAPTSFCSSDNPIQDQAEQAVEGSINWQSMMSEALNGVAATIPASGKLDNGVTLNFAMGPSGLSYPSSGTGLITGVTAVASYKGDAYTEAGPASLPLPAIPTDSDALYYVSDYAFNGLLWAFYQADMINYTFTPDSLPDPSALETATYQGTNLQILFDYYGSTTMQAGVSATLAPSVSFQTVWQVTHASVQQMVGNDVPTQDTVALLGALAGEVFTDQGSFEQAVTKVVGANETNTWFQIISNACGALAAVCTLPMDLTISVFNSSTQKYEDAFEVSVTLVFFLNSLMIGQSTSPTQSLKYGVEVISSTTPALMYSKFPSINGTDIQQIWVPTLRSEVMSELGLLGQQGVPLPRIQGCSFPGGENITINSGYIAVATNLSFPASSGSSTI